jgi:hypothetical protein
MTAWYGPAYDETSNRGVLTVEAYLKAALDGSRHENRKELADIGIPFLQDKLQEWYGISASEDKIKVRFERETSAQTGSKAIQVDFREMTYRGKRVSARALPSQIIPFEDEGEQGYDPEYGDSAASEEDDYEDSDWDDDGDWEDDDTDEEW